MTISTNKPMKDMKHYQAILNIFGWALSKEYGETDAIQEYVQDSQNNTGILLSINGVPYVLFRIVDEAIIDPLEIYQTLLFGWNLNVWGTILPGSHGSLRFYNTTYKPDKNAIFTGEEPPIIEVNIADFFAI